jgi:hypothetical protein
VISPCPICETEPSGVSPVCSGCGFPVDLFSEASQALQGLPEVGEVESAEEPLPQAARHTSSTVPRDPASDPCYRAAKDLRATLGQLEELGVEPPDVISEMRQAALVEADRRAGEALSLLRNALVRANRHLTRTIEVRLEELEGRREALAREGVQIEIRPSISRIRSVLSAAPREEGVRLLNEAAQRVSRIEQGWRELRSLLEQVDQLRAAAESIDKLSAEIAEEIARARSLVAQPEVELPTLDEAGKVAAHALSGLQQYLPSVIEAELSQHDAVLASYTTEHEPGRRGRSLHTDTSRHLKYGRLSDAARALNELRSVMRDLAAQPPMSSVPPPEEGISEAEPMASPDQAGPAPVEGAPESPASELEPLLSKARLLATRVRSLPKDSDLAFEAAAEIRRATELLRARNLPEADATLTNLMRRLDAPAEVAS